MYFIITYPSFSCNLPPGGFLTFGMGCCIIKLVLDYILYAAVAEQADARDLKSLDGNIVPVRSRSAAPPARAGAKPRSGSFFLSKTVARVKINLKYSAAPKIGKLL